MILDRNEKCWCGSGLKYKKCHLEFDEKIESFKRKGHIVPPRNIIKSPKDIEGIKRSAKINDGVLDLVASKIKAGMSTADIDKLVYDYTIEHGAIPAPLNFEGFPKSVCTSINNEVCHGIPDENIIIKDGDIINVDVSTILDGYYSDASRMFMIGEVSNLSGQSSNAVSESICLIKNCIEAVNSGKILANNTDSTLRQLVNNIEKATDLVSKINDASSKQAEAIDRVHNDILKISNVIQENSATAQESAAASAELSVQSESLNKMIEKFRIE